jgi:ParB family chromosome partitioning protein
MQNTKNDKPTSAKRQKPALGKGLDALIPDIDYLEDAVKDYFECEIDRIIPNKYQPRERFNKEELEELSLSIKERGIIQPILVRDTARGYELIAGERRLRAAKLAGLQKVPVIIKNVPDEHLLEMSIIENIQREDLNPMEEAEAYNRLIEEFKLTQEKVAVRVGKSRPSVANLLRLRQLPDDIKDGIKQSLISMGHARALLGVYNAAKQMVVYRTIINKNLSVRETERLINRLKSEPKKKFKEEQSSDDIYFESLAEDLSRDFGTKVVIQKSGEKGKVVFEYYSNNDLDRLIRIWRKNLA